jgi:hypothetical protein
MDHTKKRANRKHQFEQQITKPTPLSVKPDTIPASMKARRQWVVWCYEWKIKSDGNGKWDKPPYQAKRPQVRASSTNPKTWATFNEAMATYLRGGFDGIGYVFAGDEVGFDLDDVRDPATCAIERWAVEVVNQIGSYAEISPSGTGIKIIAKGTLEEAGTRRKFTRIGAEMYCSGRYFTVTGHVIGERSAVEDRQAEIDAVYKVLDERNEAAKKAKGKVSSKFKAPHFPSPNLTDDEIISKASAAAGQTGKKFRAFMQGEINGYASPSEADLAFCNLIVFWTDDPEQVRRIIRASGMNRDKWNRDDYAERTIQLAFAGRTNRYDPRYRSNGQAHHEQNGDGDDQRDPFAGVTDDILDEAPEPDGPPESDILDQAPDDKKRVVTNFRTVARGRYKKKIGLSPDAINSQLIQHIPDWPKAVAGLLFVEGRDKKPRYLEKPTPTFSWLATQLGRRKTDNCVNWSEHGDSLVSRAQFHEYLRHAVEQFDGVEHVPHFPPIPRLYYMCEPVGIGDGSHLNTFLGFFSPATAIDRQLALAFVASLVWGGDRGKRPAWLITGPDQDDHGGRGVGKTAFTEKCASIAGGVIAIADPSQAKADEIERRLLSPGGRGFRVLMIDNLKALKFSWSYLESIITSDTISGRQMYVGEGRRANTLTTVITANGATLSRDMAQRCNVLKLARPTYAAGDWDDAITDFIHRNRQAILADLNAFFQRPRGEIDMPTRWGPWQNDVLSRLENPTEIQAELERRSKDCDADDEEKQLVRDEIMAAIELQGYDPANVKVKIRAKTLANLVNQAMNERMPTPKANAFARMLQIRELCGFTRRGGRKYIWVGADADRDSSADLEL